MAAAHSVPSEVEKSEEEEDPVKVVMRWVVKALLQEEERALVVTFPLEITSTKVVRTKTLMK